MKNNTYFEYQNPSLKVLNSIKAGDLIKVNDWPKPMKVVCVSDNYFVMIRKQFSDTYYSVCEKKPWEGIRHNDMIGGYFHCGKDNWIFGSIDFDYNFNNVANVKNYLQEFEKGETELSQRNAIAIRTIFIKRC